MEHLRELFEEEEEVEILEEELSDSSAKSRDDPIQGRGKGNEAPVRETWGLISASLGAMRPLVAKLDKLLLAHPNDGMRLLSDDVKKISSYVDELSDMEDPPRTAKCWMNEARGLSYDMEDYIDSTLLVQPAGASLVAKDMEADEPIAAMVSEFSKYVEEAIERHEAYVLPHSGASSTLRRRFVSLGSMVPTLYEDVVIDGRMSGFINTFAEDGDKQLKVVSLLGPACLGKTTLARVLYNKLGKRYHCRAFIRVSRKPDRKRIFREMLWQLQQQEPPEYRNEVDLINSMKKYLRNKRYLIIIDDIWAASVWDIIDDALPKGSHGSRIVTTTQIEDVALTCCCHQSNLVFEMKPLDDDHSRELFFNRVFGSESDCPEIFQEVSNKIVEICDGLPFATISIASLLASQPVITEDLLKHIHKSVSSFFSASPTSERTRQALNLSYNNLPPYLKTCLLNLGMYPEGYTFYNDDLVKQWMAEGFIDTTEGQDAEKVAESYLHQLIGRRFIQPIRINYNNEVLFCAVHDTVHDLIAHKSAEENFIVAIDYSQKNMALSHKARRLSLLFGDAKYAKTPANITKKQVRSLTFFGILECMPCITEYKLLRVLDLQLSDHGGEDNPVDLTGISELIQLRYLKIGCGVWIKLPTDGLKCLETLDITDAVVISSSRDIILPRLLHLSLPFEGSLMYWNGIKWILGQAGRLNSLEYLYITFSSTDSSDLEKHKYLGGLMKRHGNLRTAVFSHRSTVRNNVVRDRKKVITSKPSKEMITSGAPLLQRFECSPASGITFSRIPKWLIELENLCILKITVRVLDIGCVDILRRLRVLTVLSLHVVRENPEMIIFDKPGFSALKYFSIRFPTGIAWLKFEEDTMPNLLKLKLVFDAIAIMDRNLFFVSSHTGRTKQYKRDDPLIIIEHIPSLREIYAKFRGAAADLERIKGMGISNDPSNPTMQFVDCGSYGDQQEEKDVVDETLDRAAGESLPEMESLHVFTLDELMSATSNFSRAHFEGDNYKKRNLDRTFCRPGVYAGYLCGNLRPGLEQQQVVVKCLNKFSDDHQWMMLDQTELEYLAGLCHPHLVKLLGFCDYYEHRMLVYEDMPKKNLKQHFFKYSCPSEWLTRLKIAVGTAEGLAFLHEADKPMAHGDFNAASILFDSKQTKLFGYRQNSPKKTLVESDVYNFGVVLLELLAGRQAVPNPQTAHCLFRPYLSREDKLLEWSRPYLSREDKLHHVIDPMLKGQYSGHAAWSTAAIVRRCLRSVPEKRPSMRDIVEALEPLLLLVDDDKPSSQTKNAANEAPGGAGGGDDKAGGSKGSKSIQLDANHEVSCRYPSGWQGRHEFTLDELMSATSNFSEKNLIGEADFGHIYKGVIDGKLMVAVMKLRPNCDDWLLPMEWLPELQNLESTRQPHLVRLLGYCNQDEQCVLLIYEYMPRGCLSEINLLELIPWLTRLSIAVGVAKGLASLHESGKRIIYYTGFTSSCVLLALDYTAKLWGFGPAKQNDTMVPTRMTTDVYNFGAVLLELLTGRLVVAVDGRRGPELDLVEWSRPYLCRKDKLHHIIDPRLKRQYSGHAAWSTATIMRRCLNSVPEKRPSMRDVLEALEPLLLLIDKDKPLFQTKNAGNKAQAGAGDDDKAGGSDGSKSIQLDVNRKDSSSRYPPEWGEQHKFTLDELMSATSNFSEKNLLGEADFGPVYKGSIDGTLVAVMKLRPDCDDWLAPRDWLPELQNIEGRRQSRHLMIGQAMFGYPESMDQSSHEPHLVRLLGCCDQDEQCVLLVYEYMPRGSLSENSLLASIPWLTRLEIAVGAARGLMFLHNTVTRAEYYRHNNESVKPMIYYTGFTASSIMLASDYTAKLWGFGPAKKNDAMLPARMTTDVYNFGVVLLELLVGRAAVEEKKLDPEIDLQEWLASCIVSKDDLHHIMDPSLEGQYSVGEAFSTAKMASRCLQKDPQKRPPMLEVVLALCSSSARKSKKTTKWAQSFIENEKHKLVGIISSEMEKHK